MTETSRAPDGEPVGLQMKNNWTSNWSSCDCLADAFGSEWRRFQYLVLAEGAKLHPSCRWDGCTERKSKIVIGQWLPSKVHKWFKLQQSPNWDLFTAAGVYWTGLPRCCEIAFGFSHWIEMLGFLSLFCFQYFQTTGPFILWVSDLFLSDIVVRCFAERLPQSDLQGHEGAHRHVKQDLPDVPQFVQIHVGKTDECKGQEGLAVPPDWEVGKQVALKGERQRAWTMRRPHDWRGCFS